MLYHMREIAHAGLAPARAAADLTSRMLRHPDNPWRETAAARWLSASCELFDDVTRRYDKPEWGVPSTLIDGAQVPVTLEVVQREPFCDLLHFRRGAVRDDPRLLVVAPMSGHYATLLRDTVRALLPNHDVYVTDWLDAAMVPLVDGGFDLDDYIDYVIGFLHTLGPDTHVLAVCQPAVPVLAAVSVMAARKDPLAPSSMTLIGGPIDTRVSPTVPNDLAMDHPLEWFEEQSARLGTGDVPGLRATGLSGFHAVVGFHQHEHPTSRRRASGFFQPPGAGRRRQCAAAPGFLSRVPGRDGHVGGVLPANHQHGVPGTCPAAGRDAPPR